MNEALPRLGALAAAPELIPDEEASVAAGTPSSSWTALRLQPEHRPKMDSICAPSQVGRVMISGEGKAAHEAAAGGCTERWVGLRGRGGVELWLWGAGGQSLGRVPKK